MNATAYINKIGDDARYYFEHQTAYPVTIVPEYQVLIIASLAGHEWEIGDEVTVCGRVQGGVLAFDDNDIMWILSDEEFEAVL